MAKTTIPERGVYAITASDGRSYVGSSTNIASRWSCHRSSLRLGKHYNSRLQSAWTALGADAFCFEILERLPEHEDLIVAEQKHIDALNAHGEGFNICPSAGTNIGCVRTEETRQRMGAARVGLLAGERNWSARLVENDVREIRRMANEGILHREIAALFSVTEKNVSHIVRRRRWKHVA